MIAIRLKEMMTISCGNSSNKVEGFGFYKQSIILKKKSDRNSTTNYYIMRNI